jgi:hypothetical protein
MFWIIDNGDLNESKDMFQEGIGRCHHARTAGNKPPAKEEEEMLTQISCPCD